MHETSLPARIELLIGQLEEEVRKLSFSHQAELTCLRESHAIDLLNQKDQFDQCIALVDGQYKNRIKDLEGEISYLKELNSSQRIMMEDNFAYMKGLEAKLNSTPSLG